MFGIAGTAELSTFCPGTRTWNRLQDGNVCHIHASAMSSLYSCTNAMILHALLMGGDEIRGTRIAPWGMWLY